MHNSFPSTPARPHARTHCESVATAKNMSRSVGVRGGRVYALSAPWTRRGPRDTTTKCHPSTAMEEIVKEGAMSKAAKSRRSVQHHYKLNKSGKLVYYKTKDASETAGDCRRGLAGLASLEKFSVVSWCHACACVYLRVSPCYHTALQ